MKKVSKKILIPIIAVALVAAVVVGSLLIPRNNIANIKQFSFTAKSQKGTAFSSEFKEVLSVGGTALYLNEKAGALVFKNGNTVFNSASPEAAENSHANILDITLRDKKGNSYALNSTDNSVALGGFDFSQDGDSLNMNFGFYENTDTKSAEPLAKIGVVLSVENNAFKISSDASKATCSEGYTLEKISFLSGLFSSKNPVDNAFYTIPDGCGAELDLTATSAEDYTANFDVYGSDVSLCDYSQGATLPCFAYTNGDCISTVFIDDGDALASVNVKKYSQTGGELYNTFTVTPYGIRDGKLIKGETYNGTVSQAYSFATSGNLNYNIVATTVRENLISKGYLPDEISGKFTDFSFFVTVVGSENGKSDNTLTTFENASEIIALLKSRGVRSMALRFAGGGKNGLDTSSTDLSFSNNLGGVKGYTALCDTATQNNSSVWYDINFAADKSKQSENGADIYSDIRSFIGLDSKKAKLNDYSSVENNISTAYKAMADFESSNVCINDLSYLLYTDFSTKTDRQAALENIKNKTEALAVGGGVMLAKPAVYLLNQADAVFEVPQKATCENIAGATSVPLLQMVLHGSVCYGTEPVNVNSDTSDAILKAVEYGASPSFIFTYDGSSFDYGLYATQTAKSYSLIKRVSSLADMKITAHEKVASGVYKVTYNFNKIVYINYNPSVVQVDGIMVSAKDFVII